MGKARKEDDGRPKYDYNAHTIVYASTTRPCINCGRNSTHKKITCK